MTALIAEAISHNRPRWLDRAAALVRRHGFAAECRALTPLGRPDRELAALLAYAFTSDPDTADAARGLDWEWWIAAADDLIREVLGQWDRSDVRAA